MKDSNKSPTQHKWHPLSYSQQRLWMFHQVKPKSIAYNVGGLLFFEGDTITAERLLEAVAHLFKQHSSLRLIFDDSTGEPLQRIDDNYTPNIDVIDLPSIQITDSCNAINWIEQDAKQRFYEPYNIKNRNLTRLCLYKVDDSHFALLFAAHHLITDAWSLPLCCKSLVDSISGKTKKAHSQYTYLDFAAKRISDNTLNQVQKQWQALNLLADTPLELPNKQAKINLSYSAEHIENSLSKEETAILGETAKSLGVTRFEVLSSALLMTLSAYGNNSHPAIMVPALNRDSSNRRTAGFYVNNTILGLPLSAESSLQEIVQRTQSQMAASVQYSAFPLEQLSGSAGNQQTLPNYAFNFRTHGDGLFFNSDSCRAEFKEFPVVETPFELVLDAISGNQLNLRFVYAKEKFSADFIHRFIASYKQILATTCLKPTSKKVDLPTLSTDDTLWLNSTSGAEETWEPTLFTQLFTEQVLLHPDSIALKHTDTTLTYSELNTESNRLAHYLLKNTEIKTEHNISTSPLTDKVIGVMMERGTEMMIAMIAIMKAGAAFLPLDPDYPADRLRFMLEDSGALCLLTQQHLLNNAQNLTQKPSIALDNLALENDAKNGAANTELNNTIQLNSLAYLIYTSGSTGTPKGVAVDHLGLAMHVQTIGKRYGMTPDDCELHFASISFDGAIERWTVPLAFGSRLIIRDQQLWTPERTTQVLRDEKVTIACFPPSYMGPLLDWIEESKPSLALRSITLGGEAFTRETFERIQTVINPPRIINGYGPTETVVTPMIWSASSEDRFTSAYAPIGTAVGARKLYVLDENLVRLPAGSIGELYIGMEVGLARGYFQRPDLTAERFLPDPFAQNGERMYRTGDLVTFRVDGAVEYLGRADQQVKIRGFRIELGEIESRLQTIAEAEFCAVVAHKSPTGTKLVGYVQLNNNSHSQKRTWISALTEQLPDYMVPSHIVISEKLPLTPAGKIDRNSLMAPEWNKESENSTVDDLITSNQTLLASIWCDLLKLDFIGANSHFFASGGDSIMALQLVGKLRRNNLLLTPKQVFDHPVLADMAECLIDNKIKSADQVTLSGSVPLLPMQARFIQNHSLALCNQHAQLYLSSEIDITALRLSIEQLVSHHDALRLTFSTTTSTANYAAFELEKPLFSLQVFDDQLDVTEEKITQVQTVISPEKGLNLSVGVNTLTGELIIAIHHLVVDALSWLTLIQDLVGLYSSHAQSSNHINGYSLPEKTHHQADWHQALCDYPLSTKELDYWAKQRSTTIFPTTRGTVKQQSWHIEKSITDALFEQTKCFAQLDKETSLLAVVAYTLAHLHQQTSLTIHKESHGRYAESFGLDLSRSVNWFTALFPQKIYIHDELGHTLTSLKDLSLSVVSGGIGYSAGIAQQQWMYEDYVDVLFNYLGSATNTDIAGIELSTFGLWRDGMPADAGIVFNISETDQGLRFDIELDSQLDKGDLVNALQTTMETITTYCRENAPRLTLKNAPYTDLDLPTLATVSQRLFDLDNELPEKILPLSTLQQGLYFHTQLANKKSTYVNQITLPIKGASPDKLVQCWQTLMARHAILRTTISHIGGQAHLLTWPSLTLKHEVKNIQQDLTFSLSDYKSQLIEQGFKLEQTLNEQYVEPLWRIDLLQTNHNELQCIFTIHHLLMDGWSTGVLLSELFALYQQNTLPPVQHDFSDYLGWVAEQEAEKSTQYWQTYLAKIEAPTHLAVLYGNNANDDTKSDRGHIRYNLDIEPTTLTLWQSTLQHSGLTLNTLIQAAWLLTLQRYTGQDNPIFGNTVAGRPTSLSNSESMIGLFINTLPVTSSVNWAVNIDEWLNDIQLQTSAQREFSFSSLADVQTQSPLNEGNLFDTLMVFENYPLDEALLKQSGLEIGEPDSYEFTHYPLTLAVLPGEYLRIVFAYDSACFNVTHIDNLSATMSHYLEQLIQHIDQPLSTLHILDSRQEQIIQAHNKSSEPWNYIPFTHLISEQAKAQPNKEAVVSHPLGKRTALTYQQLDQKSDALAAELIARNVGRDNIIGVLHQRGAEMLVSMLGVLKAGAAFLPLDPSYPEERLAYMLEDSQAKWLITDSKSQPLANTIYHTENTLVFSDIDLQRSLIQQPVLLADQLAYVIYTSGSTGKPKGVCVSQLSMSMHVQTIGQRYDMKTNDIELHFASISFDGAIERWSVPLAFGSSLIVRDQQLWSAAETCAVMEQEKITIACFPPSYVGPLLEWIEADKPNLCVRSWTLGGEAFTKETYFKLQQTLQPKRIINGYGPTETVITPMIWQAYSNTPLESAYAPIGTAVGARALYVLDKELHLVPSGVVGELYIGNEAGLARGYLERPDLTAERFIPDPFSRNGERMYRTGDLVRWRTDGVMEYQGRVDDQIKIRGFRIELGEIESRLQKVSGSKQSAVVAFDGPAGTSADKYLVGYLEASPLEADVINTQTILDELSKQLPDYMVPSQLVIMDKLPLTPASKIDKKKLLAPEFKTTQLNFVAPQGEIEQQLAKQWQTLFKLEEISRHDDFFNLGGQSLLATQLVGRLQQQQNIHLPLQAVFEASELHLMAARCVKNTEKKSVILPITPVPRLDFMPVSTSQKRLWFVQELMPDSSAYHMPLGLNLSGEVKADHLEKALQHCVNKHEILRTSFTQVDGELMQVIHPIKDYRKNAKQDEKALLEVHQATDIKLIEQQRLEWIGKPFDLARPPLLRAYLVEHNIAEFELLLVIHHIVSDGISIQHFVAELAQSYQAFARPSLSNQNECSINTPLLQYADYAHWQKNWLTSDTAQQDLAWWKNVLKTDVEPLVLHSEVARNETKDQVQATGKRHHFTLSEQQITQINTLASAHKTTVFNVMLSLWHLVLHKYSDRSDIRVGIPVAGRTQPETTVMQGCFINNLVTSSKFESDMSFASLLLQIKTFNEQALARQNVPFEVLVEALGVTGNLQHHPLYQTSFNFQQIDKNVFDTWGDIKAQAFDPGVVAAQLELSLDIQQFSEKEWSGFINYAVPVFDDAFAATLLQHWLYLLEQVAIENNERDTTKRISELTLINESDSYSIKKFNQTDKDWGGFQSPVLAVIEQAKKTPDAIALSFKEESITYAEFDRKVTQLANWLRTQGVQEESRIGLGLPRSIELIIGLHAITRAGGAYVPLDPSYPSDRLLYILESAKVELLLTDTATLPQWPNAEYNKDILGTENREQTEAVCRYIAIDTLLNEPAIAEQSIIPPSVEWHKELALYVIFTSGSTGLPKGVVNNQAALQNRLEWMQSEYQLNASDCILQKTPFSFDVSVWEFFWPLMYGARLAIAQPEHHRQPELLHKTIIEQQVSTIHFVPSMLHAFESETDIAMCTSLKRIICSGEALPAELADKVLSQTGSELHNLYGPTEAAIDVSYWQCKQPVGKRTPIGYAISNTQLHVLDSYGNPTPIGLPGELYLAGDGLARGYLERPDLTADRFVPNPWGAAGSRMYRTGDKVIRMSDGRLEYLDRLDHQVKIRGLRIELEEIENVLNQHPMVEESAVIAHDYCSTSTEASNQASTQLVAYVINTNWNSEQEASVKVHLNQHLPDYMVPALFVALDAMPLSPSGKRDRKALPAPEFSQVAYRAPETELENWFAEAWQKVLTIKQVGLDDNFFALGGHSLLATKIVALAQKDLGLEITLKEFFDANNLQALADNLQTRYQTENENEQDDLDAMAALLDDLELL